MTTGFVFHELYLWHDTQTWALFGPSSLTVQPGWHAENPETKRRIKNLFDAIDLTERMVRVKPKLASDEELGRVHTAGHIAFIRELAAKGGGEAGDGTAMGAASDHIARLAAGGTIAATDAVLDGVVDNAYALTRPPGHHAEPDRAMGFCLFGNIAVAARHALAVRGLNRIAVVDWDVHHGNGTQAAFYDDPRVLTISLHQDRLFPTTSGFVTERGRGDGLGSNINVPLPPGSGNGAYLAAFDRVVLPALAWFRPDLIYVASGLDAAGLDPLSHMMVSGAGFRGMTERILQAAAELCGGRLVLSHEGGYSEQYAPYCALAIVEALMGREPSGIDPFSGDVENWGGQELQPHQNAAITQAEPLVAEIPV